MLWTGSGCHVAVQVNVRTTPSLEDTLMGKSVMTGGTKMRGGGRDKKFYFPGRWYIILAKKSAFFHFSS